MCEEAGRRKQQHAMFACAKCFVVSVCACNGMERSNLVEIEENIKGKQALS